MPNNRNDYTAKRALAAELLEASSLTRHALGALEGAAKRIAGEDFPDQLAGALWRLIEAAGLVASIADLDREAIGLRPTGRGFWLGDSAAAAAVLAGHQAAALVLVLADNPSASPFEVLAPAATTRDQLEDARDRLAVLLARVEQ